MADPIPHRMDERTVIRLRAEQTARECHADACAEGRKPCPCPDACHVPTDARQRAILWRAYVLVIVLALLAGLLAWSRP